MSFRRSCLIKCVENIHSFMRMLTFLFFLSLVLDRLFRNLTGRHNTLDITTTVAQLLIFHFRKRYPKNWFHGGSYAGRTARVSLAAVETLYIMVRGRGANTTVSCASVGTDQKVASVSSDAHLWYYKPTGYLRLGWVTRDNTKPFGAAQLEYTWLQKHV